LYVQTNISTKIRAARPPRRRVGLAVASFQPAQKKSCSAVAVVILALGKHAPDENRDLARGGDHGSTPVPPAPQLANKNANGGSAAAAARPRSYLDRKATRQRSPLLGSAAVMARAKPAGSAEASPRASPTSILKAWGANQANRRRTHYHRCPAARATFS
jgi:hypothetical protein